MDETMVERVARAICNRRMEKPAKGDAFDNLKSWAASGDPGDSVDVLESYRDDARAAIEALMEPSVSMEAAAVDIEEVAAVDWVNALFGTGVGSAQQIIVAGYRAMLSEALSPSIKEQERT